MKSSLYNYLNTLLELKKELVKNINNKNVTCSNNLSLKTIISTINNIDISKKPYIADFINISFEGKRYKNIISSLDNIIKIEE